MEQRSAAYYTLGCKLNFAETSTISRQLEKAGFETVEFEQPADVYVINTCSVTELANRKCRNIINRALAVNPEGYIVVVGCYAQLKPSEIADLEGVDLVLGANEKFNIHQYLTDLTKSNRGVYHACDINSVNSFFDGFSAGERTRSFLKVQDGCDYSCAFCTIPLARGKSRSDSIENVVANAHRLAAEGIREIVLTGVNTGDFGKGLNGGKKGEVTFYDLIRELDKVEGIDRYRISSIEPNLLTNEIIDFVAQSDRFMPHFHIPLQSGSNKMLKLMRRRYLRELYADRVAYIKDKMPHACIGVDIIIGFPNEEEEDFMDTYNFVNGLDVSYFHVFTYSERPNTAAAEMGNQVPKKVRGQRSKMLRILSEKKRRHFYEQFEGAERPVLFEGKIENGFITGHSDNYIKVKVPASVTDENHIEPVQLTTIDDDGTMKGQIATPVTI